ncbi:MAG: hypothetical protein HYY40_11800 [Bacteroidetes bacterium]|nr:hypothetical protein [Bacteroidota bacterium]
MIKYLKITLFSLLVAALIKPASAIHVAGGDITFKFLSAQSDPNDPNVPPDSLYTYEIIFHYYLFCKGPVDYDVLADDGSTLSCPFGSRAFPNVNYPDDINGPWPCGTYMEFNPDASNSGFQVNGCYPAGNYNPASAFDQYGNFKLTLVCCKEATENCPDKKSRCDGGPYYGVTEYIYSADITLPRCSLWTFAVSIQNRNAVNTLPDQPLQRFYLETKMNNFDVPRNSSPTFSQNPIIQPLAGKQFIYSHGTNDTEFSLGHTLEWSLVSPATGPTTPVIYKPGYTYLNPFGPNDGLQIDAGTGTGGNISATPPAKLTTIMAVIVNEYNSGGTWLCSVVRDIQINVDDFSNTNPILSGIIISGQDVGTTIYAGVGNPLNFTIIGTDDDTPDQEVTLCSDDFDAVFAGTNASFPTPSGGCVTGYTATGAFTWTPTANDIGQHCFTVTAVDAPCAMADAIFAGKAVKTYCITVVGSICTDCPNSFAPEPGKNYILSAWVKENDVTATTYTGPEIMLEFLFNVGQTLHFKAKGNIIDGWQRIEEEFTVNNAAIGINVVLKNTGTTDVFFDDIRIFPVDANMKSFVYDPVTRKLAAELDERNYATFYEYDEEGSLIRVKKETERGIMTIQESRSSTRKK